MKVAQGTDRATRTVTEDRRPNRPAALWPLLALMGILSVGGFIGGVSFVSDRTGAGLGARLSWLDETPVSDFLLPGLFLIGVYGVLTLLLIAGLVWRPSPRLLRPVDRWVGFHWSWAGTIVLGLVLVIWIAYEFTIFPDRMVLQPLLIAVGTLMVAIPALPSMRSYYRTTGERRTAMRTEERIIIDRTVVPDDPRRAMLRAAQILSWIVLVSMAASGIVTLTEDGLLSAESPWAREAFRGGELISLFVAVPLLAGALVAVRRGSARAPALWIGMLLYAAYNYAYAVFGSTFNDAFLLHIGAFSASVFALACAMPALDYARIAEAFGAVRAARGVGIFLILVGAGQGLLWLFILVRNAITGEVLHDIPVSGQHLVFALDLALLVPSLILAGVLLYRHRPFGIVFATGMAVMGAVYQLNLMMAGVYGAAADVAGAKAFPPESVVLTAMFIIGSLLLWFGGRSPKSARGR